MLPRSTRRRTGGDSIAANANAPLATVLVLKIRSSVAQSKTIKRTAIAFVDVGDKPMKPSRSHIEG